MTPERFTDWLQGFVEIANTDTISEKQWQIIKDHLKLVFDKKTPDRNEVGIGPLEIKPALTGPIDWKRVSDLIGKEVEWNKDFKPPYTITCGVDMKPTLIC